MVSICGKIVHFLRTSSRISRVRLSPGWENTVPPTTRQRVKPMFFHELFQIFPQLLSTRNSAYLPLGEHIFYPVSTAPTINITKGKIKERL